MVFSLSILQQYLSSKHGILPERVNWSSTLRHDLHLSDCDIQRMLTDVTEMMNIPISIDTEYHLTDVFDLMVYVLLRSTEAVEQLPDFKWITLIPSPFPGR